jgi:hypothetical protein
MGIAATGQLHAKLRHAVRLDDFGSFRSPTVIVLPLGPYTGLDNDHYQGSVLDVSIPAQTAVGAANISFSRQLPHHHRLDDGRDAEQASAAIT